VNAALPKLEATRPLKWSKYAVTFDPTDGLKCAAAAGALPFLCSPTISNVLVTKTHRWRGRAQCPLRQDLQDSPSAL
jgi:hypothetical protein